MPPSARTRAARDARSTFPQSHARAARCAWQGEVSDAPRSLAAFGACPASLVTVALRRILHSVDNSASGRFGFTAPAALLRSRSGPWLSVYSVQLAGLCHFESALSLRESN